MFIVIIFLTIVLISAGVIIDRNSYGDGDILYFIGIPACIISFVVALVLGICISSSWVVDEKINMYEVENSKIDSQICTIVENYKGYEKGAFESLKNKNADTLISLYPELKTDTLVKEQIKIYTNNRKQIIKLKQKKLMLSLYVGGYILVVNK